jgi:hypothetical protein
MAGGWFRLESHDDLGTTVEFMLPIVAASQTL